MEPQRINITSSDMLSIHGFVFLKNNVREHSKMFLHKTNILTKSLNSKKHFLMKDILNDNTEIDENIIHLNFINQNSDNQEKEYKNNNISSYLYYDNLKYMDKTDNENKENYKAFLNAIVPKTSTIITNFISNELNNIISYEKILDYLESFNLS